MLLLYTSHSICDPGEDAADLYDVDTEAEDSPERSAVKPRPALRTARRSTSQLPNAASQQAQVTFKAKPSKKGAAPRVAPKAKPEDGQPTKKRLISDVTMEFVARFKPAPSKIDKPRKHLLNRPPTGKAKSHRKQGARGTDVKADALHGRLLQFPEAPLSIKCGQLHCDGCGRDIGSAMTSVKAHLASQVHQRNADRRQTEDADRVTLSEHLHTYFAEVKKETGCDVTGSVTVSPATRLYRAETIREFVSAGIEVEKLDPMRPFLETHSGHTLTQSSKMQAQFLPPIRAAEITKVQGEVKDELYGICHDETPYEGEAFGVLSRTITTELDVQNRLLKLAAIESTVSNENISSLVISTTAVDYSMKPENCLSIADDAVAANVLSYEDTTSKVMNFSDLDLCMPHGCYNTGGVMDTPLLDEFLVIWNTMMSKSVKAVALWWKITGKAPKKKKKGTRWWIKEDIAEACLLPALENGNLVRFSKVVSEMDMCEALGKKLGLFLQSDHKRTLFWLELVVMEKVGSKLRMSARNLEHDNFAYLTGHTDLLNIEEVLRNPITKEMRDKLAEIAKQAPAPKEVTEKDGIAMQLPPPKSLNPHLETLLAMKHIAGVRVSVNKSFWNWRDGENPQARYHGGIKGWANKKACKVIIQWEDADAGTVEDMLKEDDGTAYLTQAGLEFQLEAYEDGRAAPKATFATPFHIARADLQDPAVLEARADAIVAPASHYFKERVMKYRSAQVSRMKAARVFDPRHVGANGISEAAVTALSCFKLVEHPRVKPHYKAMLAEVTKYKVAVASLPPLSERQVKGRNGKVSDSFCFKKWWNEKKADLPHFFEVLRAVLTHTPNSCAAERVFSLLTATFNHDQRSAYADYIETSLMLQFNKRSR